MRSRKLWRHSKYRQISQTHQEAFIPGRNSSKCESFFRNKLHYALPSLIRYRAEICAVNINTPRERVSALRVHYA